MTTAQNSTMVYFKTTERIFWITQDIFTNFKWRIDL